MLDPTRKILASSFLSHDTWTGKFMEMAVRSGSVMAINAIMENLDPEQRQEIFKMRWKEPLENKCSFMKLAVVRHQPEILLELINWGGNVNETMDEEDDTPLLHIAVHTRQDITEAEIAKKLDVISRLVRLGADTTLTDKQGTKLWENTIGQIVLTRVGHKLPICPADFEVMPKSGTLQVIWRLKTLGVDMKSPRKIDDSTISQVLKMHASLARLETAAAVYFGDRLPVFLNEAERHPKWTKKDTWRAEITSPASTLGSANRAG